jgi:glucose/mannose transport system substrate-binding protein
MHNRLVRSIALTAVLAAALAGCAGGAGAGGTGSDPNNADQVEILTWWTDGSDQLGNAALQRTFEAQFPKRELIDSSVNGSGGGNARKAIAFRLDADNPPDSFLAHNGAELSAYVEAGALQDLNSFYTDADLASVIPASLIQSVKVDGKVYGVPINVHRANVVWANTAVLAAAGIRTSIPPVSIDEWLGNLEQVRASGVEFPLALGESWTQVQLFENVLLADLGPDGYLGLWSGDVAWDDPRVDTAIGHYGELLGYANPNFDNLDWTQATALVMTTSAAYTVIPDWADGRFRQQGLTYGKEYIAFATPGTDGLFDYFADSFTLPVGAAHDAAARDWLTAVASADGQLAFSKAEGSIPARNDIDISSLGEYQQKSITAFANSRVVPSLSQGTVASPTWLAAITTAVVDFGHSHKAVALSTALVNAAAAAQE